MKIQKLVGTTLSLSLLVLTSRVQAGALVFHPAPISVQTVRVQPGLANFSAGNPGGIRTMSPNPLVATPANEAWERNNAWANYSAQSRQGVGGGRSGATSGVMLQQNRMATPTLTEGPQSPGRYNFQFSNNEVRSVQQTLRRLGYYSGQPDGLLGPDTRKAIQGYQIKNNHDATGQPDRWLMTSLGIF
jgi:hypothetical protein